MKKLHPQHAKAKTSNQINKMYSHNWLLVVIEMIKHHESTNGDEQHQNYKISSINLFSLFKFSTYVSFMELYVNSFNDVDQLPNFISECKATDHGNYTNNSA